MTDIHYMDLEEFHDEGFLQEANRRYFHPLGMALEVSASNEAVEAPFDTLRIWDFRDDPEGVLFTIGQIDRDKIARVDAELMRHKMTRIDILGHVGPQRPDDEVMA